ncbi:MAG: DUF1579 domain-containing protein [Croceibacterium sp.]
MKIITAAASAAILSLTAVPAAAQQRPQAELLAAQKAALAKLAWMDGEWRGPAVTQTETGEHRVTQTERIGPMIDGTLKVVEGRGFNPDGTKGFNAFGVISFNPYSSKYEFRAYAQGNAGTFAINPTSDGYVWETPAGPGMIIRYTATLAGGTWTEVGDRIAAGKPAVRFFEMHLKRVGNSPWPGAGAMKAK